MNRTPASEVGGESVTTMPQWPLYSQIKSRLGISIFFHSSSCNGAGK